MAIPKFQPLANASASTKKIAKPILGVILALLIGAFGLQATDNDLDLGKLLSGESVADSRIETTSDGTLLIGDYCKKDKYNCSDFKTQSDAQKVFTTCGGTGRDVNGLDGNNNGLACESLPDKSGKTSTE